MTQLSILTDRKALDQHRRRALLKPEYFLYREIAADLKERLSEINKSFSKPAIVGGLTNPFEDVLRQPVTSKDTEALSLERQDRELLFPKHCRWKEKLTILLSMPWRSIGAMIRLARSYSLDSL